MSIFRRVAVQAMRRNRTRTLVTIIGVILSAAMFTAVTTFAGTLMHHLQRSAAYQSGTYYLSFLDVDAEIAEAVAQDKDTEALATAQVLGYARVDSANENKPFLYVHGMDEGYTDLLPVHLLAGRLPENSTEARITQTLSGKPVNWAAMYFSMALSKLATEIDVTLNTNASTMIWVSRAVSAAFSASKP